MSNILEYLIAADALSSNSPPLALLLKLSQIVK